MTPTRLSRHLEGPIARGAIGTVVLMALGTALGFATNVVLARVLGPSGFGAYAFGIGWLGLLAIPATLGLDRLLVRELAQRRARGEWGAARGLLAFADLVGLAAGTSIALAAAAVFLRGDFDLTPELRAAAVVAAAILPALTISRLRQGALRGVHRVVAGQLPDMLVQPALLLLLVATVHILAQTQLSGPFAVALYGAAAIVACLVAVALLRRLRPAPLTWAQPERHYRAWLRAALPFMLIASMATIRTQTDVVMLGFMLGAEPTGIYRAAARLADLVGLPLIAVTAPLGPLVAALSAEGRHGELQARVTRSARAILAAALPVAVVLTLLGPEILSIFGGAFAAGHRALAILAAGLLAEAALGPAGLLLSMSNRAGATAAAIGLGAAANVVLNLILIPAHGIEGAATATAASLLLQSLLMVALARTQLAVHVTVLGRLSFARSR